MLRKLVLIVTLLVTAGVASAQDAPVTTRATAPDPTTVQFVEVAGGLNKPIFVTHAGDGSGRLFIVQQSGQVLILQDGAVLQTPFLDISGLISQSALGSGYSEQGLLGLAFHPYYANNGLFYVDYTDLNGDTVVAQYQVSDDANLANPDSAIVVLTQDQPFGNHNGGDIAFGPDGYLYIAFGDGGSQGDPNDNAQNKGVWLGKILRIEVHEDGTYTTPADNPVSFDAEFAPEVWAYGLRNPWRFSFDPVTGDLYIGDVGGGSWEEINFEPANSPGGVHYGWDAFEGNHPFEGDAAESEVTFPVAEYDHGVGITVVGGYVYRGTALPDLNGVYFYGDWGTGTIWSLYRDESGNWVSDVFIDTPYSLSSFGVDEQNELYVVNLQGRIYRFAPA